MGQAVKYKNDLNTISFRGLRPVDMDLFWAIVAKIRDKGEERIFFSREEISKLANYGKRKETTANFIKDMEIMADKLGQLNTKLEKENGGFIRFVLFPEFDVDEEGVWLEVSKRFAPWFNQITGGFTRFELETIIGLKSGYTKELFRHLMQYKSSGFMSWSTEDLREKLAVPKSQKASQVDRILNKCRQELLAQDELGNQILSSLTIKKIKGGYRNSQIVRYEFSFKVSTEKIIGADSPEAKQLDYEDKSRVKYGFSQPRKTLKGKVTRQEPIPGWYADYQAQSQAYQNKQSKRIGEVQDVDTLKQLLQYDQELAETTAKINRQRQELADRRARFEGFKANLKYMPLGAIEGVKKEFPEWAQELG